MNEVSCYLATLSNAALLEHYEEAKRDSALAAAFERGSEYHVVACTALLAAAVEIERRKICLSD